MKFDTTKNKIRKLWERVDDAQNETNNLKKINIRLNPVALSKKIVKIELLNQYTVGQAI